MSISLAPAIFRTKSTYFLDFYYLYSRQLFCKNVFCQHYSSESAFSQRFKNLVFIKVCFKIKLLSSTNIHTLLILNKRNVLFLILNSIDSEKAYIFVLNLPDLFAGPHDILFIKGPLELIFELLIGTTIFNKKYL